MNTKKTEYDEQEKPKHQKKKSRKELEIAPDDVLVSMKTLDTGPTKLTEKEKRFVFWYTYPGSDAFQVQSRAAEKAGYKDYTREGYRLRTKDTVAKAIKYVLDSKLKLDLEEEFHRIIAVKKARVHYDIGDYVEIKERTFYTKSGESYEKATEEFKNLCELTAEQRMAIDAIDYKTNEGYKVYVFADRDKAMNDLLSIYKTITGTEEQSEEDNIEFTAEILKEGLKIKATTTRKKKDTMRKNVALIDTALEGTEEL